MSLRGIEINVLDCVIVVSVFELHSHINFWFRFPGLIAYQPL